MGPITDAEGAPIDGANVSLVFSRTEYKNATGIDGMTTFVLSEELLGNKVIVSIEKSGYKPIFYTTTITAEGRMETFPPPLEAIEESNEEGGSNLMIFFIIIAIMTLLLAVAILLLLRKQKKASEE